MLTLLRLYCGAVAEPWADTEPWAPVWFNCRAPADSALFARFSTRRDVLPAVFRAESAVPLAAVVALEDETLPPAEALCPAALAPALPPASTFAVLLAVAVALSAVEPTCDVVLPIAPLALFSALVVAPPSAPVARLVEGVETEPDAPPMVPMPPAVPPMAPPAPPRPPSSWAKDGVAKATAPQRSA